MRRPSVLFVRNIPRDVAAAIARRARETGTSLNRAAVDLLREAIAPHRAPPKRPAPQRYDDLDHLIGCWTPPEQAEFDAALRAQRRVDPRDWR